MQIKIGHNLWNLQFVKDIPSTTHIIWGRTEYSKQVISVLKNLPTEEKRREVILHELLHVLIDFSDLRMKNEEQLVTTLARNLCMIIKDNPKLKEMCFGK